MGPACADPRGGLHLLLASLELPQVFFDLFIERRGTPVQSLPITLDLVHLVIQKLIGN
jgi:hypothetical protein